MANKRVRTRKPQSSRDLLRQDREPMSVNPRRLTRRKEEMDREIHRLECLIATSPAITKARQFKRRDTLPPPEPAWSRRRASAGPQRMPLAFRRAMQRQRLLLIGQLAVLLVFIAALAGWSKQWLNW